MSDAAAIAVATLHYNSGYEDSGAWRVGSSYDLAIEELDGVLNITI